MTAKELYDFAHSNGSENYELTINVSNQIYATDMIVIREKEKNVIIAGYSQCVKKANKVIDLSV